MYCNLLLACHTAACCQQERTIASAFAASPTMASELALEARQWRKRAERAGEYMPKHLTRPGSYTPVDQRRDLATLEHPNGSMWVLDLHQMSAATARVVLLRVGILLRAHITPLCLCRIVAVDILLLLQRLEQLTELVTADEHPPMPRPDGLEVITG